MPGTIAGGCLFGAVRFETENRFRIGYCHCSICRKWTGAIFGTPFNVARDSFRFVRGEDEIAGSARYRHHCGTCGSSLPGGPEGGDVIGIPGGLLDHDPGKRPAAHIFVGSKVPWLEIEDGLPQFERYP